MAKNLKGITIDIGGNTEPLEKSLDSVNKTSRSLQVELRQVEKLLKLDPTNTELLVQKQNLLADSISSTSEKLDALKAAEAQVQAQFEKGEIAEEQYRAFQREIVKTENELNNMKSALQVATRNLNEFGDNNGVAKEESEKLNKSIREQKEALEAEKEALKQAEEAQKKHKEEVNKAKKELDDFKKKAEEVADKLKKATLVIGGATIAGAGYALNLSNDFDKAFNTLINKTGAAEEEFDSLNEAMERIYANNFGENIDDVAESLSTVRTTLWLNGEELQKATEYALGFRDVFDVEVNESTRAAKALMDNFGLSTEQSFNMLVQGYQEGLNYSDEFIDTVNEYSSQFKKLGLNVEDMFSILDAGTQAGAWNLDKIGDAIKELSIRVIDGSDTTKQGFELLGLNADEMAKKFASGGDSAKEAFNMVINGLNNCKNPIDQNLAGTNLLGTMWEDLGASVVTSLSTANDYFDSTYNSMEELNNITYDNIGSAITGLGRELQVSVIEPLGEELKPVVEDAISYVQENGPEIKNILSDIVEKIGEFVGFIVNNSTAIIATIGGIATGLLAWNVASIIQGVVGAIKAFKLANEGATIAQLALNAATSASGIGLIVGIIGAVITAIITLWTTNEDFRNAVIEIWNNIKEVGVACWEAICTFFTETIPEAWNSTKEFFEGIPEWFKEIWDKVLEKCQEWGENIKTFFQDTWENVLEKCQEWGNNIRTFFTETIPQVIEDIVSWFSELPYKIGYAIGVLLGTIIQGWINIFNYFAENIPLWIENISTWFSELPGKIWTWLVATYNNIVQWGTDTWNKAVEIGTIFINTIVDFFIQLPGAIWNLLVNAYNNVVSWGSNMFSKAVEVGSNFINSIITWIQQLPGKFSTWLNDTISKVISFASNLGSKASQAGQNMFNNIINAVKNLPSQMASIGKNIVEGVWSGITGMGSWLSSKVSSFFNGIVDGAKKALGIHSPSRVMRDQVGKYIAEGVGVGIEENSSGVMDQVSKMNAGILDESKNIDLVSLNRTIDNTVSYKTLDNTSNSGNWFNSKAIPDNAVFQIIADGQIMAEIVTPYQDIMNGGRLKLAGRGLAIP